MSFLRRFRHQEENPEIARRTLLMSTGRVGEATILGLDNDAQGKVMLSYCYTIAGADYETVQELDEEQMRHRDKYLPGSRAAMRYDPRRPTNSLVV